MMPPPDETVAIFNDIRTHIKKLAAHLKMKQHEHMRLPVLVREDLEPLEDRGEVLANLMLAYRHLEDASMRMGKAIQARDGGVSVYDRKTTVGA